MTLMTELLRVPRIYAKEGDQARYAENRAAHVAATGELLEAVATLIAGHSSLCFSPFENGKGDYLCTCGEDKYTRARMIIGLVESAGKESRDQ